MPDYEFEKAAVNSGFSCICGVDEAGRGPLAGPVCAAGGNFARGRRYYGGLTTQKN